MAGIKWEVEDEDTVDLDYDYDGGKSPNGSVVTMVLNVNPGRQKGLLTLAEIKTEEIEVPEVVPEEEPVVPGPSTGKRARRSGSGAGEKGKRKRPRKADWREVVSKLEEKGERVAGKEVYRAGDENNSNQERVEWRVEKILNKCVDVQGTLFYRVKWEGWSR